VLELSFNGQTHRFDSEYQMTEWVIKTVVPIVLRMG
jgi:hypothetical protein